MSLFKIFKGKAVNLPTDMHDGYAYFTTDDGKFYIDASVDGILKRTLINPTDDATGKVKSATVAEWAQQTSLISEKDVIYVYTDHQTDDGKNIPGIKIGDGLTYVVDLPFVDTIYMKHITDTDIHITVEERAKWNKVNSAVPNTRTVNGKALSSDISLGAGDVGAYTKSETDTKINAAVASAYKYKGSVTVDKLPTSGQVVGDVYNITNDSSYGKAGMNVAWNGTTWDALGSNVDLSNYVITSDSRLSNARPASDVYAWAKAASKPSYSASEIGAAPASHTHTKDQVGLGNVANLDQSKAIKSITRNGTTFTATALDGTTSTFTQQDVNATYGLATSSADGLMSKSDKAKLDGIGTGSNVKSVNGETGAVTLAKGDVGLGNVANIDQSKAIKSITRSGTTFTATALDGTQTTFTQQDTNTTYPVATTSTDGLMSAADKKAIDREFFRLLPKGGTHIPPNADLNTIEYIKVGNYYNPLNAETGTMKNCPSTHPFMMYVLSPLSEYYDNEETSTWVYRLRIFIDCGRQYIFTQRVSSGKTPGNFTYGPWVKMTDSNDLGAVSNTINDHIANKSNPHGVTKAQVGLGNVDNTADSAKSVKYASSAGSVTWNNVSGKPSTYPPSSHTHDDRYEIAYRSNFVSHDEYIRLGIATMRQQGDYLFIRVYSGSGYNGQITQDRAFDIHLRTSNGSGSLYAGYVEYHLNGSSNNDVYIVPNSSGTTYAIWIGLTNYSGNGFYIVEESNGAGWSNSQTTSNSIPSGAIKLTQKNIAYTSDIPTSLPANGGNSATVNGHSVNANVPSGAKFTDTTYGAATQSSPGLMSAADKTKLDNLSSASTEGKEGVELTIPVGGWSSNTTAVNGTDYYTYSTTNITGISNPHPTIVCSSASGVLPSAEEKMAFDNISFVTVDTSSSKITFYAPTKPNSTVVLIVKDFTAENTSSASANLTIATSDWSSSTTSINGAKYYIAKKTVSGINQAHPPVICHTASSSAALPSKAEQTAYNCIDYTTVDTSTNIITFYATTKPSAAVALTMV